MMVKAKVSASKVKPATAKAKVGKEKTPAAAKVKSAGKSTKAKPASKSTSASPNLVAFSIEGVLIYARAIFEQHRSPEFIQKCKDKNFKLHGSIEFREFVGAFIDQHKPSLEMTTFATKDNDGKFVATAKKLAAKKIDDVTGC